MNYTEATEYINSFTKSGRPANDLSRFRTLMSRLGDPQDKLSFVHVAGTNGKGSVCEYIACALRCAGKTVGKFTSPYIDCIEERIQLNGKYISKQAFAIMTGEVKNAVPDELKTEYSQFEILCAAAMLYFANEQADCAVIEVGIGGLYDCTNIITPLVSVITDIGYDHTDLLGDTLESIAYHKAGIIKPAVPAVISPAQPEEAYAVISARCAELSSPPITPDISRISIIDSDNNETFFSYKGHNYHIVMAGEHQIRNAVCAIEACRVLNTDYGDIFTGLERSRLHARMEHIKKDGVEYIIDGSHNISAMRAAALLLDRETAPVHAVVGMLKSKDITHALPEIIDRFQSVAFVDGFADNAESAESLCETAKKRRIDCAALHDLKEALNTAVQKAGENGIVMVTGSLYLASAARKLITG